MAGPRKKKEKKEEKVCCCECGGGRILTPPQQRPADTAGDDKKREERRRTTRNMASIVPQAAKNDITDVFAPPRCFGGPCPCLFCLTGTRRGTLMIGVLSLTEDGGSSLPIVRRGTRGCARDPGGDGWEFSVLSEVRSKAANVWRIRRRLLSRFTPPLARMWEGGCVL